MNFHELHREAQRRVLDAIEGLGYRPNLTAQSLRTRRTRTIGFVTDEIAVKRPGGRAISAALDVARKHGSLVPIYLLRRTQRLAEVRKRK